MPQSDLERAISRVTGESPRTIRRRGFSLVNLHDVNFDPEPDAAPPQIVDWDAVDADRQRSAA